MSTCEIIFNKNNIPEVKTYPLLFKEIMNYYDGNVDNALSLYGMTMTDEFKDLKIKKPNLEDLLLFSDNFDSYSKKLDKDDIILFTDLTLNTEDVDNLKDKFVDAFSKEGIFDIDKKRLKESKLFTDNDIEFIINLDDIKPLQSLYYGLKNGNDEFQNIVSEYIISKDGMTKINPDGFYKWAMTNYIGIQSKNDVYNKALSINDDIVVDNPQIIETIEKDIKNKQKLQSYETEEYREEVVNKKDGDTKTTLMLTLDVDQDFTSILDQLTFLITRKIDVFVDNIDQIQKYLNNLEIQFAEKGIDMSNFSEIGVNKSYNELQDFIGSLYNFLLDLQNKDVESLNETIEDFSNKYDLFFGKQTMNETKIAEKMDEDSVYLYLETNLDEETLFKNNSIIKFSKNIYQKITDNLELDELYELIYQNPNLLPKEVYSVKIEDKNKDIILEDIDEYVTNESKKILTPNSDNNIIKKIQAYKILNGIDLDQDYTENLNNSYLQGKWINPKEFLIDFNKKILKNKKLKDIFYFSNRGLEARYMGEYTKKQLEIELTDREFKDLQQYALLSDNDSISYLKPEYELMEISDVNILRNYYANNIEKLKELENPYQILGTTIIVKNVNDNFIKVKGELYEKIKEGVYELVKNIDYRYKNYNLKKPKLSLSNIEDYVSNIDNSRDDIKIKKNNKIENEEIEFC